MTFKHVLAVATVTALLPATALASGPRECDINGTCAQIQPEGERQDVTATRDDSRAQPAAPSAESSRQSTQASSGGASQPSRAQLANAPTTHGSSDMVEPAGSSTEIAAVVPVQSSQSAEVAVASQTPVDYRQPTNQHTPAWQWMAITGVLLLVVGSALWLEYSKPSQYTV